MSRAIAALGLAVLVLLATSMVALTTVDQPVSRHLADTTTTSSTAAPSSTTTTTAAPNTVDRVVASVESFVASTRELTFKKPVPVTLLSGDAFKQRLLATNEENDRQIDLAQRSLRALHLVNADVNLRDVVRRFVGDAVVGFYDAKHGDLVLRGGQLTPYARVVLAHELTHALDDQWFGIDRPELDKVGNEEAGGAFQALVEGNAVRVQQRYEARLSTAEQLQAALEEQRAAASVDLRGVPDVVREIVTWPYEAGPTFVQALLTAGGEQRVDDALKDPPTTTEEIAEPTTFLAHRAPAAVPTPKADGSELVHGVFGWSSLVQTLEPVVGTDEATTAANGWAGDAYVLWDAGGGRSCVRATFVMRTPADLAQLTSSLDSWGADRHAQVVHGTGDVSFTSCG